MRAFLVVALVAACAAEAQGRFDRINSRTQQGRSKRGLLDSQFAFFEFAPANGFGMPSACSCTVPSGAKGESLTFTRTGTAVCQRSGFASSGIPNGDLVLCSANQPRIEAGGDGVLGIRIEKAQTNYLLRYDNLSDLAWANVATPTLTTGQTDPFGATTATSISDSDAVNFAGRSQSVSVTAGQPYTMHCYVKANTQTKARLSLDGTTADISGLSTTTWNVVQVTDTSASAASISAQVLVGNAGSDTGSVIFGGCQVEDGSYRTSLIPTTSAFASRGDEDTFTVSGSFSALATTGSVAATITAGTSTAASLTGAVLITGSSGRQLYLNASGARMFDGALEPLALFGTLAAGTAYRTYSTYAASSMTAAWVGTTSTTAYDNTMEVDGTNRLCTSGILLRSAYICSRVCVDPNSSRCR